MREKSIRDRITKCAMLSVEEFLKVTKLPSTGLDKKSVEENRNQFGSNTLIDTKHNSIISIFFRSFFTPFSIVLFILGIISFFTEFFYPESDHSSYSTVIIILSMVLLSGIIRFSQEVKSKKASDSITRYINTKVYVYRNGKWNKIDSKEIVVGDYVKLKSGERVPCDIKIIKSDNLFVSQAIITGESNIIKKNSEVPSSHIENITQYQNIIFLGSNITSGTVEGVVIACGKESVYGEINSKNKERKKGFDKGANSIAGVLIKFMLLLVPIVFVVSGLTKHNPLTSFLFSLSVAVGLTPELLPMVITACLGKGTFNMRKKQTIVKNVNAMQGFGSIDTLCVDKTGTLTGDSLILEYYMDIFGNQSQDVLDIAYLTSFYHTGLKNHVDNAILNIAELGFKLNKTDKYRLIKELPFDYIKKSSSVLLQDVKTKEYILFTKGEVKSVINNCSFVSYKGKETKIVNTENSLDIVRDLTEDGMKVLAISYKRIKDISKLEDILENQTLIGYIAFFDAPKASSKSAITKLKDLNINIKVLTGDDKETSISICKRLGLDTSKIITGKELDSISDNEILSVIENTIIFTDLIPKQKALIVSLLKTNGHKVGFLGDGMNDLSAIIEADVGISVDTADVNVKEMADVVLLKKDLNVLEEGILEGRKAFANMLKYIKITASSNFGNILAILIASLILPFFPMSSLQILLLNLLYDILCLSLPWDNVDEELYKRPLEWGGRKLSGFMLYFGPLSVIFDIITFTFLLFFLCPFMCGASFSSLDLPGQELYISIFQTGWFLESMWSQVLILHLLRTKRLPFIQSKPSLPLLIVTLLGITFFTILSLSPIGSLFGFTRLPLIYFVFLVFIVICYLLLVTLAKKIYLKKRENLL